jgi:YidC/Oxa1 family membrane protein insertase
MDRKQLIGLVLIFILIALFSWYNNNLYKEEAAEQMVQDSTATVNQNEQLTDTINTSPREFTQPQTSDSIQDLQNRFLYGDFHNAVEGEEKIYTIENDRLRLSFSNRGGRITEAWLKNYKGVTEGPKREEIFTELKLMNHPDSKFEYLLPVKNARDGVISTGDLFFEVNQSSKSIVFSTTSANGATIQQSYTLTDNPYKVDYRLTTDRLEMLVDRNTDRLELNWEDYLNKIEKNDQFEKTYATLQYKILGEGSDYCSFNKDDTDELENQKMDWVSNSNQFFSSVLMSQNDTYFEAGDLSVSIPQNEDAPYLKKTKSQLYIPVKANGTSEFDMAFYIGPNKFDRLKAFNNELEQTINFGRSVFGTINRWVIRPLFLFFLNMTNSAGIAILLLILLVKTVLYPLTYRMLKSSAKMGALKPEITQIKEKYKDDSQTTQMKTMELYRKFGVSPFGGCMPMILQMPIWFALFRFFPASFEFRQRSFLWATDLSSYDALFHLPFEIPMFGGHLSLFALLWTISTLVYTYYNMSNMDMGNTNPAMKYMQYFMPVVFIVFFNNYASGLTAYMFFSTLINIIQTVVTKKFVFDEEKIRAELELKKDKPKKKNTFSQRLEEAMKQQQKAMEDKQKKQGKKK